MFLGDPAHSMKRLTMEVNTPSFTHHTHRAWTSTRNHQETLHFSSAVCFAFRILGPERIPFLVNNLLSGVSAHESEAYDWLPPLFISSPENNWRSHCVKRALIFQGRFFFPLRPIYLFLWQFQLLYFFHFKLSKRQLGYKRIMGGLQVFMYSTPNKVCVTGCVLLLLFSFS